MIVLGRIGAGLCLLGLLMGIIVLVCSFEWVARGAIIVLIAVGTTLLAYLLGGLFI